ncbi:MAG: hypothetical protein FJY18_06080, partial [Bacteroidetes bacterium]|nr:hypothetical protein [Bacteroidota bacterium]
MKKYLLFLFLLLGSIGSALAQVSSYGYINSNAPYVEITGGTLLGAASNDDQRFVDPAVLAGTTSSASGPGFPIGFDFVFNGYTFNRVAVNTNGWIFLGSSSVTPSCNAVANSYTPISYTSSTAVTPADLAARISAFGRDLQGQTGAELRIETIGDAPNRRCVVQWKGYRKYSSSTTLAENLNFQIQLHEGSNNVVIAYGSMATNAVASTAQVGMRGLPLSTASNFRNLTSMTTWTSPILGTASTSTMTYSSTVLPPTGTTLTFSPPLVCSGAPSASTVSPASQFICSGSTPGNLTATGQTPGYIGFSYQWEQSTDGGATWGNAVGGSNATTLIYTPPVYAGTSIQYRLATTCSASAQITYSTVAQIDPPAPPTTQASALSSTSVGQRSLSLSWTAGTGARRLVVISNAPIIDPASGSGPAITANTVYSGSGQQIVLDGTGTSVSITGLACGITYYTAVYDYNRCGAAAPFDYYYNTTAASNFATFTTNSAVAVPVTEGFATTTAPANWTTTGWLIGSTRGVTGNPGNNIYRNMWSTSTATGTFTSAVYGPMAAGYRLKFDYKIANYSSPYAAPSAGWGHFKVSLGTNCGSSYLLLDSITDAGTGWVTRTYDLSAYSSGDLAVKVDAQWVTGDWDLAFDNFIIEPIPSCDAPSALTATSFTNNSASLSWTASASSSNYEVAVQAAGAGAPSGAGVAVSGTSYAATGLNAATNYEYYVRTVCSGGNSPWAGPFAFSTAVCAASSTCNYTINMTDTYGDGWDGTVIGLRQSGILVGTFGGAGFASGSSATATVALCPGLLTEIVLVTAGSYPNEKRFTIVDPFGVQVYALSTATTPLPASFGTFTSSCTPPACAIPTALASSSITTSGATISWTAGGSEASWEISIQAPGLGEPTGNGTSITTNPYLATGLTSNTSYQVYLRAVCSPTNKSNWVGPISIRTLCDVFTMPFFESFETAQGTASCWSGNLAAGSTLGWQWIRLPSGSAPSNQTPALPDTLAFRIPFYSIDSGSFSLNTPVFVASAGLSTVSFNYAYAAYSAAENDQLEIMGSTDGGTTYTTLELMNGGPSGPLNTGGTTTASFVPTVSQWGTKTILLPAGTNRISFKGISAYGNNLYIDNVRLAEVPPCLAPSNVSVASSGISARGASVSWDAPSSAPANGYGLFVSTTNSAPVAGAAATSNAASSPAVLSGLTPNTTYYVWVRSLCAYNSSEWAGGVAFTTSCDTSAIPFAENFDALTPTALPGVIPTCWSRTTNVTPWRVGSSSGVGSVSAPNMIWTTYNGTLAKNDWMYTPSFALNAGISYALRFRVRAPGWAGTPEKLAVYVSGAASPASMTAGNKIYENLNLTTTTWVEVLTTFTPSTTGNYFIGWHAFSVADVDYIAIDNVSLGFTPPSPIAGFVRYGNTAQTPLSNVKVTLWNTSNNTPVDSLTTDASGAYSFTPGPGSFEVRSSTSRTPGGWNATGALAIGRHYANVNPLQGLYLSAADVTANSQVNASDALQVLLRYLTVTNSFAAGSWVFEKPSVTIVQGATVPAFNITGLSVGDVRGAFTPGARLTSKAKIESGKDELLLTSGQIVRIPVYLDEEIDLGAISLALGYDARQLEVLSVRLSDAVHNTNMVTRVNEPGLVSLAWFDVQGWSVRKGSVLFELECLVKNVDANGVSFRVMEGSELASKEVEVLDMAKLRIPNTRGTEGVDFISLSNYPNPFDGQTSLRFNLPTEGSVTLRVLDVAGREVASYDLGTRAAGLHTHDLELNVQAGVYSAELLFNRAAESTVAVTRMIR